MFHTFYWLLMLCIHRQVIKVIRLPLSDTEILEDGKGGFKSYLVWHLLTLYFYFFDRSKLRIREATPNQLVVEGAHLFLTGRNEKNLIQVTEECYMTRLGTNLK